MKKIVTYFSASGKTERKAKELAELTGADLFEIQPETPYTKADLNWMNPKSRSSVEMKNTSSRPALKKKDFDFSSYEEVYIGFPIWWYTAPTIINTFLETYDFSGKVIRLFATSGGSGIEKACKDLASLYPSLHIAEGRLIKGKVKGDFI